MTSRLGELPATAKLITDVIRESAELDAAQMGRTSAMLPTSNGLL